MMTSKALIVLASGLELTFTGCDYDITDDGYLWVYTVSGPNGKSKSDVAYFNEWTMVAWVRPEGLDE